MLNEISTLDIKVRARHNYHQPQSHVANCATKCSFTKFGGQTTGLIGDAFSEFFNSFDVTEIT